MTVPERDPRCRCKKPGEQNMPCWYCQMRDFLEKVRPNQPGLTDRELIRQGYGPWGLAAWDRMQGERGSHA